jgi:hypothetical protein
MKMKKEVCPLYKATSQKRDIGPIYLKGAPIKFDVKSRHIFKIFHGPTALVGLGLLYGGSSIRLS